MDAEQSLHLNDKLQILQRRLQILEQQAAAHGLDAPPAISIEIEDTRAKIKQIESQLGIEDLLLAAQPSAVATQRRRWARALKAYFRGDWVQAEKLLMRVLNDDPGNAEAQNQLIETQHQLKLSLLYRLIGELRAEGDWRAVLAALDELERLHPSYPGAAELRSWAEEQQRCEQSCAAILAALNTCIVEFEILLKERPTDNELQALFADAKAFRQVVGASLKSLNQERRVNARVPVPEQMGQIEPEVSIER
jgi:hypothetical protein